MRRGTIHGVRLAILVIGCAVTIASSPAKTALPELTLYAAASLRDVLQDLAPGCGEAVGVRLVFNFGASSDLARQIVAGNKADLFFSADETWMDHVARAGLVDAASRRSLLSNRLVVVARADAPLSVALPRGLADPRVRKIALANPEAVPAGTYARSWLLKIGLWDGIKDRVVPALDVRAALAAVESGGVEMGIVYKTDAAMSRTVRVVYEVPDDDGPRIEYPLAALKERPRLDLARRAAAWLSGPAAAPAFERRGFILLGGSR